jgi:hypothetical protein
VLACEADHSGLVLTAISLAVFCPLAEAVFISGGSVGKVLVISESIGELPSTASPLEGVLLLALHLQANRMRLTECQRLLTDSPDEQAAYLLREKSELLHRFRAILGSIDGSGHGGRMAEIALCELTGLSDLLDTQARPPKFPMRRRELSSRLDELENLESRFLALSKACDQLFCETQWSDEFRVCVDMSTKHHEQVVSMRRAH